MGPGGRAAPPGRVKAKACLDPAPCRGGEGAGLGVERVEGSEETLHPRRIDEGLTVSGESAARRELGPAASMEGSGLGFEAGSEADRARIRREGEGRRKRRHGTRRLPARGAAHEDGQRQRRVPRRTGENREKREGEADKCARRGFFFFSLFFSGL